MRVYICMIAISSFVMKLEQRGSSNVLSENLEPARRNLRHEQSLAISLVS